MRGLHDQPIRQKLMIAIVGTSGLAVFLASVAFISYHWLNTRSSMVQNLDAAMAIIASNSTAALSFNDALAAEQTLSALRAKQEIRLACIYTKLGEGLVGPFASYRYKPDYLPCPVQPPADHLSLMRSMLARSMPIRIGDEVIGNLYIERGLDDYWQTTVGYILVVVLVLIGSLLMAFAMSALLQRFIAHPILSLAHTIGRVSKSKDYSIRMDKGNNDEVGLLIDSFNDMLTQIGSRDQALKQAKSELEARVAETDLANAELHKTLQQLKQTQEQLIQTEKMASLGGLVAGIAHEINTPVGVGVTAASTLQVKTVSLRKEYATNTLTNSALNHYIELATQSTDIILNNLNRASELIHSFKQVAVDQSSCEKRRFAIKQYLNEVLLSLRPKLKKTRLQVIVNCDDALEINSYPGALAQVITNLIMNSLIHAYEPDQNGRLTISVEQQADSIYLHYADDGKGMPVEHVARVFDPFFTTKRGSGGSGLGMHIVYNLVTQQLGGTIKLRSEVGKGTDVDIIMPARKLSQQEQPDEHSRLVTSK